MGKSFRDDLKERYERALQDFERAKAEATKDIERIQPYNALEYGAAYFTKIDKVTSAGARVMELANLVRAYEYYNPDEPRIIEE